MLILCDECQHEIGLEEAKNGNLAYVDIKYDIDGNQFKSHYSDKPEPIYAIYHKRCLGALIKELEKDHLTVCCMCGQGHVEQMLSVYLRGFWCTICSACKAALIEDLKRK